MISRSLAIVILLPFLVLTAYAVSQVGLWGIVEYHLLSPAGWQVFTDLIIAIVLILGWLIRDAQARGMNPWPWVIATVFTGSIAPLVYLVITGKK